MAYFSLLIAILLTVYGQIVFKWQVNSAGVFPDDLMGKILFIVHLLVNPWVISTYGAALLASLFWMVALTRFELSYAYPFMSLTFMLVLGLGAFFFHEAITVPKVLGVMLIGAGIFIGSQG